MFRANLNPLWFAVPVGVASIWIYFRYPSLSGMALLAICGAALIIALQAVMGILNRLAPAPVPAYAVQQLFEQLEASQDDWLFVEFEPALDLASARQRAQNPNYTQQERKSAFLKKARLYAPTVPHVAFFYSANKGYLLASRRVVETLLRRYGKWTLDSWRPLVGAAQSLGMTAETLDESKLLRLR